MEKPSPPPTMKTGTNARPICRWLFISIISIICLMALYSIMCLMAINTLLFTLFLPLPSSLLFSAAIVPIQHDTAAAKSGPSWSTTINDQPFPRLIEASIEDLTYGLESGLFTSVDLVNTYIARIAEVNSILKAVTEINPDATAIAAALDEARSLGEIYGPLHGIPILIKDNYDTADMPTSGGALALATLQPAADAFQVKKLREAGAVILGKTAMHELAAGITTISSLTGQTRNPYDLYRVPGGSSGGTGAAIGASFAAAGMGSDTCGSIRIPAANQNLVGLRGTHGLSSRSGVMPLSSTQDIAGPLARSVTDLAIMLDAHQGGLAELAGLRPDGGHHDDRLAAQLGGLLAV